MRSSYHWALVAMYDARVAYEEEIGSRHPRVADRLVQSVAIAEGAHVLDLCTGTGLVARKVAQRVGSTGKVIGVDVSSAMLEQARRHADAQGCSNIDFVARDANSISFEPCSFDLIFCCEALVLLDDPAVQLRAWHHWLKPDGLIAFTCTHEGSYFAPHLQRAVQVVLKTPAPAHMHQPLGTQEKIQAVLTSAAYRLPVIESELSGRWRRSWQLRCDQSFIDLIFKGDGVVSDFSADQVEKVCRHFRDGIGATEVFGEVWEDTSLFYVQARKAPAAIVNLAAGGTCVGR